MRAFFICGGIFDIPKKQEKIEALKHQMESPHFWDDPAQAHRVIEESKSVHVHYARGAEGGDRDGTQARCQGNGPFVDRAYVLVNGQVAYEGSAKALEADAALQARLLGVVQQELTAA